MSPIEKTKFIGGMNMFSDNLWELFTETGDIGYYLLYRESDGITSSKGNVDSGSIQTMKA